MNKPTIDEKIAAIQLETFLRNHAKEIINLVEAAELMAEVNDEDCRFDHDGFCQAHNLDHQIDGCRVAKLREALAALNKAQS